MHSVLIPCSYIIIVITMSLILQKIMNHLCRSQLIRSLTILFLKPVKCLLGWICFINSGIIKSLWQGCIWVINERSTGKTRCRELQIWSLWIIYWIPLSLRISKICIIIALRNRKKCIRIPIFLCISTFLWTTVGYITIFCNDLSSSISFCLEEVIVKILLFH